MTALASSDVEMTTQVQECSICFETISDTTGHTTLGCAHRFHLMCVVRWFQEQDGPSSCPFCRHEVGTLDNVPIYPDTDDEEGNEEDEDDSTLDGWSDSDDDEENDDADSVGSIRRLWTRNPDGGQWEGRWILDRPVVSTWDPATDPAAIPEELNDVAAQIQRIWRGFRVRRPAATRASAPPPSPAIGPLPLPATATAEAEAVLSLLKLSTPSRDWIMSRMMRVD